MKTAAEAKNHAAKRREDIQNFLMQRSNQMVATKKKRGRPPKPKVQSIREAELQNIEVQIRMELEPDLLAKIVAAIDEVYPGLRINREGSTEFIFSHYRCDKSHKRAPGWPSVVTSSGDKYYYSPDGKLYEHPDNRRSKEKIE